MSENPDVDGRQVKCPFCPVCGTPPRFIFDMLYQVWCPNEDCDVFMWVPWETAAANLANESRIDWEEPAAE